MSKLKNILKGIRTAQDILALLSTIVDIDRLIGIANAQGQDNEEIRSALSKELDRIESSPPGRNATKRSSSKKSTASPSKGKVKSIP